MTNCYCCSQNDYATCCEPYLISKVIPETPEALMRSRYTAYCLADIDYIQKTMRARALIGFDAVSLKRWAKHLNWIKLEVLNTAFDTQNKGYVEFNAFMIDGYHLKQLHEKSEFIREEGRWYYIDGVQFDIPGATKLISRSGLCPCGSLRKFKNCHEKSK